VASLTALEKIEQQMFSPERPSAVGLQVNKIKHWWLTAFCSKPHIAITSRSSGLPFASFVPHYAKGNPLCSALGDL
jgi:hypothetical protein